jgi:hypothetical protein
MLLRTKNFGNVITFISRSASPNMDQPFSFDRSEGSRGAAGPAVPAAPRENVHAMRQAFRLRIHIPGPIAATEGNP